MTKAQLYEECEAEFENIEKVLQEICNLVEPGKDAFSTPELAALGAFLHNYYNGIENILKRFSIFLSQKPGDSSHWHKELLRNSQEQGILSTDTYKTLTLYLSFRHFFSHAYAFNMEWYKVKPLVLDIHNSYSKVKNEIMYYLDNLI